MFREDNDCSDIRICISAKQEQVAVNTQITSMTLLHSNYLPYSLDEGDKDLLIEMVLELAYTNDDGAQENDASRYTPGHNSPTPPFLKNTSSPIAYAYFSITREFQQYGLTNKFEL